MNKKRLTIYIDYDADIVDPNRMGRFLTDMIEGNYTLTKGLVNYDWRVVSVKDDEEEDKE